MCKEIKQKLNTIESLDPANTSIDKYKEYFKSILQGVENKAPIINEGRFLYRGVLWNKKPHNISQLTYPSSEKVLKNQRANRKNTTLFYCSAGAEVILQELDVKPGDHIAISKWENDSRLPVMNIGFTQELSKIRKQIPKWQENNKLPKESEIILEFFSDIFTQKIFESQESLYKLSIAIAEIFIECNDEIKGIVYPSIANKLYDNLALKPNAAKSFLSIKEVYYIKIKELKSYENKIDYIYSIMDSTNVFSENNEIIWRNKQL